MPTSSLLLRDPPSQGSLVHTLHVAAALSRVPPGSRLSSLLHSCAPRGAMRSGASVCAHVCTRGTPGMLSRLCAHDAMFARTSKLVHSCVHPDGLVRASDDCDRRAGRIWRIAHAQAGHGRSERRELLVDDWLHDRQRRLCFWHCVTVCRFHLLRPSVTHGLLRLLVSYARERCPALPASTPSSPRWSHPRRRWSACRPP